MDGQRGEPRSREAVAAGASRLRSVVLAPAVVFLAAHESSYVIGEVIAVTGGSPVH